MKKAIFLLVVIAFISAQAQAQPRGERPSPEERAKRETETLKKELKLNDDQAKKVNDILLDSAKQMREVFGSSNGDRETRRAKMQEIIKKQDEKLNLVFTKEQQAKYADYQKKREEERQQRREQRGNGTPQQ